MTQEIFSNSRFYVKINEMPHAVFTEASGLQLETTVMDYEEGGNNAFVHRLPGRIKVGNLTLKRGVSRSDEFFTWYMDFVRGKISLRNVSVVLYTVAGEELRRWEFINAFPVKWLGPQFSADGKTMAIETLELAHDGLQLG